MSARAAKWQVWSWVARHETWMAVDEGPKTYAEESARYRNAAAERLGMDDGFFMALPPNTHPGPMPASPAAARKAALS